MDSYKIIHQITLGNPGATITEKDLLEAGVNIAALLDSGHIECVTKTGKKAPTEE